MRINIKPLSVNEAWQGKRFKTKKYKQYEKDVLLMLPKVKINDVPMTLAINFGFSNKMSDVDNPVKCFVDCLQKKYGFNDRNIHRMILVKDLVKKGDEYIEFNIVEL
jgi:Holliday junction resolvase RusA-like endonuclease